ncbi:uncharacterized protein LOC111700093 [Eurytemora carolleeae]|uniref:uncharacterized protein LOC111700093 n=1 Tax=Eurytemora carolleeae TaxID=1294199 RepID=UPI000C77887A|nr:uncharacterized protein LOC111700093 [Eurytemora carolleeae]XP_023326678.1 uncharacterized protein LOC111700093 [Eurytemora carolleeae]|eukprot:XP_023326677.1 uncharacterized protein LOC111700093 [Eurytemora affinis]
MCKYNIHWCRLRTGVLLLPFCLGIYEWIILFTFWKYLDEFRVYFKYKLENFLDFYILAGIICVNFLCNVLLICAANKDYSGRNLDLRRWWLSLPWIVMYGLNIIGLFTASLLSFFRLEDLSKIYGLVPLVYGVCLLVCYIYTLFFIMEQKHKRTGIAIRPMQPVQITL